LWSRRVWHGIGAPRATPSAIIDGLIIRNEINAALADTRVKARFADLGGAVIPGSSADSKRIEDETEKWGRGVKLAGIKPD
jgi:hypothetical protein